MRKLNSTEKLILNRIQRDLPVSNDIFHVIAGDCGLSLKETFVTVRKLIDEGIISKICADFRQSRLGYHSACAAFKTSVPLTHDAADFINKSQNITSAVIREDEFNLWIKYHLPQTSDIKDYTAEAMKHVNAGKCITFTTGLKISTDSSFKTAPWLESEKKIPVIDMLDSCKTHDSFVIPADMHHNNLTEERSSIKVGEIYSEFSSGLEMRSIADNEIPAVQLLQQGLPVTEHPLTDLLRNSSFQITEENLQETAADLKKSGILRKFSSSDLRTETGGGTAALACWSIDGHDLNRIIDCFRKISCTRSLSLMKTDEDYWDFTLFSGIRAADDEELEKITRYISAETGMTAFRIMKDIHELKKIHKKYFI